MDTLDRHCQMTPPAVLLPVGSFREFLGPLEHPSLSSSTVLSVFPNALQFTMVQLGVFYLPMDTRLAPMTCCRLIERGIKWVSRSGVDSVNSTSGSGDRRIRLHMPRPLTPFASVQAITTWGVLPFVCQLVDDNFRKASG